MSALLSVTLLLSKRFSTDWAVWLWIGYDTLDFLAEDEIAMVVSVFVY